MTNLCGIYKITNIVNNMFYLGKSVNIVIRINRHKNRLTKNSHDNSYLQHAYNKYGKDNFVFTILLECDKELLNQYEQDLIFLSECFKETIGYNLTLGGDGGEIPNDVTRAKMSATRKGKVASPETNKKCSESLKGIPWSQARRDAQTVEVSEKLSNARKGNTNMLGKHHSEETKKRIAEMSKITSKGRKHSEETKRKMSINNTGRLLPKQSEETKLKRSISLINWWKQKKAEKETK